MIIEIASLIVVNLIIASLIGFLLGYIIAKNKGKTTNTISNDEIIEEIPLINSNSTEAKPFILSAPNGNKKDNLRKIKGIDSVIEKELNTLGIFHFNQISNWTERNCQWIEDFLNLSGVVLHLQWVEQAKILETGKETIFSLKVEKNEAKI